MGAMTEQGHNRISVLRTERRHPEGRAQAVGVHNQTIGDLERSAQHDLIRPCLLPSPGQYWGACAPLRCARPLSGFPTVGNPVEGSVRNRRLSGSLRAAARTTEWRNAWSGP